MEIVVYARYGKYPMGVKCFKRKFKTELIERNSNEYLITFNELEFDRFDDFKNRIKIQAGFLFSFSIHIIDCDKWFESRVVERIENSFNLNFKILKEDFIIYGNCLDL